MTWNERLDALIALRERVAERDQREADALRYAINGATDILASTDKALARWTGFVARIVGARMDPTSKTYDPWLASIYQEFIETTDFEDVFPKDYEVKP